MGLMRAFSTMLVFTTLAAASTIKSRDKIILRDDDLRDKTTVKDRNQSYDDFWAIDPEDPCDLRNYTDFNTIHDYLVYALLAMFVTMIYVQIALCCKMYWTQYLRLIVCTVAIILELYFIIYVSINIDTELCPRSDIPVFYWTNGFLTALALAVFVVDVEIIRYRYARRAKMRQEASRRERDDEQGVEGQGAGVQGVFWKEAKAKEQAEWAEWKSRREKVW